MHTPFGSNPGESVLIQRARQTVISRRTSRLHGFFLAFRDRIHEQVTELLRAQPANTYRRFLLEDPEGLQRLKEYLDCLGRAFGGDLDAFLEDQLRIGTVRATEGYELHDVLGTTMTHKEALLSTISEYNAKTPLASERLGYEDVVALNQVLDCSYFALARSFMKTRDDLIERQHRQLEELQTLSLKTANLLQSDAVCDLAAETAGRILRVRKASFIVDPEQSESYGRCESDMSVFHSLLIQFGINVCSIQSATSPVLLLCRDGKSLDAKDWAEEQALAVGIRVRRNGGASLGFLLLHNCGQPIGLSPYVLHILDQLADLLYKAQLKVEMLRLVEMKQNELQKLAGRLISVQEQERKRLASDIHDVIAQALTGIGYGALACLEMAERGIEGVTVHLRRLTDRIDDALIQCRRVMSELHPRILDDMGVIPAFAQLLNRFEEESDCVVHYSHPDKLDLEPETGLALFRILQEALSNIHRHAMADRIDVHIAADSDHVVSLSIRDNGCGYEIQTEAGPISAGGFGLITMRERSEDLGGVFEVHSRKGRGTQIQVKIPDGGGRT